ncbi:hypothetical protein, partial [Streptomyces scabiei]|uniref:hypothetical protein n=1 Tax=Streptomyces scabiei TaxID=1930 RepID=UPI0038F7583A
LEPVLVVPQDAETIAIPVHLPASIAHYPFQWELILEDGSRRTGDFYAHHLRHLEDVELAVHHEKIGRYALDFSELPP